MGLQEEMMLAAEMQEVFGRLWRQHPAQGGGDLLPRTVPSLRRGGDLGVQSAPDVAALLEVNQVRMGHSKPGGKKMAEM